MAAYHAGTWALSSAPPLHPKLRRSLCELCPPAPQVVSDLNVASILFVLCAGFPSAKASNLSPFAPFGGKGVFAASAVVFFAFVS